MSNEAVVENLKVRYEVDEIQTFVGSVLLVLNPYRPLPICDGLERYRDIRLARAQPHIFAMAEEVRWFASSRARARCACCGVSRCSEREGGVQGWAGWV